MVRSDARPPRLPTFVCILMLALACAACGSDEEDDWGPWPSAAERTFREGDAPTPFTAEQIRAACPEGRQSVYRVEKPGRPPHMQSLTFRNCDEQGAEFQVATAAEGQTPTATRPGLRNTWKDFQSHASYPQEATTIARAIVKIPAGRFQCMLYTVKREIQGQEQVTKAWFAHKLPGPPVRLEQHVDGKWQMRMTLEKQGIVDGDGPR